MTPPTRPWPSPRRRWSAIASRASTSTTCTGSDRHGFKAGALDAGLQVATGEFVLIFDADFVAPPTSWRRPSGHFARPRGGHGAGPLGPHQPGLLPAHPGAVGAAGRPLHPGARRAQPLRPLLQLQRHRGDLAPRGDRGRRRLAARHPHRGPRPLLPRADEGLALRVRAGRGLARRDPGGDERLQEPAAPLGQGLHPDLQEAAARASWPRACPGTSRSRRSSTSPPTSPTR